VKSIRAGIALLLVGVALALTSLAYASPPDPTWVGGFWDDGDFDDVVIAITSATAIPLTPVDRPPTQTVCGLLVDVRTRAEAFDGSLHHASRSPPAPAR
jgi:hypothetical protein